ncbi:hypothetical protein HJG60_011317 [Phyllostomus discolor]|uniref:Uncharacterized protein n=1 Tax=Phyllostomus discolor TaxID=89673 RepID=A0A834E5G1_9CHIR|nr:hypothetical protein HJG60_011317 [Phyllostomus discolor]
MFRFQFRAQVRFVIPPCILSCVSFISFSLTVPLSFFAFHGFDTFEMSRLVILRNVPQFRLASCFHMIKLRVCIFGKMTPEAMLCPSQGLLAGGQRNSGHTAGVVCAGFLHYEISKNLVSRVFEAVQMSYFPLEFCPLILASINCSCLQQVLMFICLMMTFCSLTPPIFINWYSTVRKGCLFSPIYLFNNLFI